MYSSRALLLALACLNPLGCGAGPSSSDKASAPIAVELAPIETGAIQDLRAFSGSLEPSQRVVVASPGGGRVEALKVQLAEVVERGQVVAELDDATLAQGLREAEAQLAQARAASVEAESAVEVAGREWERAQALHAKGVISDAELDEDRVRHLQAQAQVAMAKAEVQAEAARLELARIGLRDTKLEARWEGGPDRLVVAERFVQGGDTVGSDAPIVALVGLDPLLGVISVSEQEYGRLAVGQEVSLSAEAWPGEVFPAKVARIAPVFDERSRQARVELQVDNADGRLKPGMFVRATVGLDRQEQARIVPAEALTSREGQDGVFLYDEAQGQVRWVPVTAGVREGDRIAVSGEGLSGRVVTLGLERLADGSPVRPAPSPPASGE